MLDYNTDYIFNTSIGYSQEKVERAVTKIRQFYGYKKAPCHWHNGLPEMDGNVLDIGAGSINQGDINFDMFKNFMILIEDLGFYKFHYHGGHTKINSYIMNNEVKDDFLDITSIGYWIAYEKSNLIGLRPKTILHNGYCLHCDDGPAVIFHSGEKFWFIKNKEVDEQIVLRPETQTAEDFDKERDSYKLNIRIERYGLRKYFELTKLRVIDKDGPYTLYCSWLENNSWKPQITKYFLQLKHEDIDDLWEVPNLLKVEHARNYLKGCDKEAGKPVGILE